jgi:hypothetical protein
MIVKDLLQGLKTANDISRILLVGNDGYMVEDFTISINKQSKTVSLIEEGRKGTKATDGMEETLPQWALAKIKKLENDNKTLKDKLEGNLKEAIFNLIDGHVELIANNKVIDVKASEELIVKPISNTHFKIKLDK